MNNKTAIIGDLHLGARGGDVYMMNFQLQYLKYFVAELKQAGITTVIQAGDFFDVRKNMNVLLMWHVINTIAPLFKDAGITCYVIDGNHDIFYRDSNNIDSNVLLETVAPDVFKIVRESREITLHGETFLLQGWINKNNMEAQINLARQSNADYLVGHLALTGFAMYKGVNSQEGLPLEPFKHFKKVYTGHYHTISQSMNIQYVGAPYHLNWADYPDGIDRGYWIHTPGQEPELMRNTEDQSLFMMYQYDPELKYEDNSLDMCKGKMVKFLVDEVTDNRRYKKFLGVVSGLDMIDYKIIDNTIVDKKENTVRIAEEDLTTDTPAVLSGYIDKLQTEGIIADAEGVKATSMDLFTRASNGK